ncbi:MAG: carbohydrate-binding protein, partial [Phycisphaerae bacterium]|nr:carbohydrate-binding protein [Phycisphaerae bacterium]
IPLDANSIIIQEDPNYTNGFCDVNGVITNTTTTGYTGYGYCIVYIAAGNGVDWSISVPSDSTYTFKWRYSLTSGTRTPRLLVNDSEVVSSISFPATGAYSNWSYVSEPVDLLTGTNNIRLESTGNGIPYIDFIIISGDNPSPASCP